VPRGLDNNYNTGLPGQRSHLSTFEDVLTLNYHHWGQYLYVRLRFNNYNFYDPVDGANLPVFLITGGDPGRRYRQFQPGISGASPTGGRFEYLAGAYFQSDRLGLRLEPMLPN